MLRLMLYILISVHCFAAGRDFMQAEREIRSGIEHIFRAEFNSALSTFKQVCDRYPDHPAGYYYMALTYQSMMMHYETARWENIYFNLLDSTRTLVESMLKMSGSDPWLLFFLGNTYAYQGMYEAKRGHLFSGFKDAKTGVDLLKRAVELDSLFYDAYIGIGNYRYWAGKYYRYIRWLPFIGDERDQGILEIETGMKQSHYSYWEGVNSLAWVQYDRSRFDEANRLFFLGAAHFDSSLIWIWGLADTFKKAENYKEALKYYRKIISVVSDDSLESGYNEVLARWKVIQCLEALNQPEAIPRQVEFILNQPVEFSRSEKAMEYRKKAEEAGARANKQLKTGKKH
jgi:tetratricopeptide (TPR) repeat protein